MLLALVALMVCAAPARAEQAPDTLGTDFWTAFPANAEGVPDPTDIFGTTPVLADLTLFIAGGSTAASGTVTAPGAPPKPFTVAAGAVTAITVPQADALSGSGTVQARAVHVVSDREVSIYALSHRNATTDAFLVLPTDVLGTHYMAMTWDQGTGDGAQIDLVATADATHVTITPPVPLAGAGSGAGVPFQITLNRGDAYQVRPASTTADLSGTTISADQPVGLLGGNDCANVPTGSTTACDMLVEQVPPDVDWGRHFETVPLATRKNGDAFRILASADGTDVTINGTHAVTLNHGATYTTVLTAAATISASQPVLLAQLSTGVGYDDPVAPRYGDVGDPFLQFIPPAEQWLPSYTITTPLTGFSQNHINVTARAGDEASITLDGAPVPASAFHDIGTSGYRGAALDITAGAHRLAGVHPFGLDVYGYEPYADNTHGYDSYGYDGGLSFSPVGRVRRVTLTPADTDATVGGQVCETANLTDVDGAPVGLVRVDFTVTGVDAQRTSVVSGPDGAAALCLSAPGLGTDAVSAAVGDDAAQATIRWAAAAAPVATTTAASRPQPVAAASTPVLDAPLLRCTGRTVELLDAHTEGRHVALSGIAVLRLAGQRITITRAGKPVGSATVAADGTFATTVGLPSATQRTTRLQATIGGAVSRALKPSRRLVIAPPVTVGGKVRVTGRLLAHDAGGRPLAVRRQDGCAPADVHLVATVRTDRTGRFSVLLDPPDAHNAVTVYRLKTSTGSNTYTLPIVVRAAR